MTGTFIMCLRKIQHWHPRSTKSEFLRYLFSGAGGGNGPGKDMACAEALSSLTISQRLALPEWCQKMGELLKRNEHPTIQLRNTTIKSKNSSAEIGKKLKRTKSNLRGENDVTSGGDSRKKSTPLAILAREDQLWDDPSLIPRTGAAYIDSLPMLRGINTPGRFYFHQSLNTEGSDGRSGREVSPSMDGTHRLVPLLPGQDMMTGQHEWRQELYVEDPYNERRRGMELDLQDFGASSLLQALALEGVTMNVRLH